ncbi:Sulfate transporter 1.2 [Zea mays]|uniref:Sulfate transporter 1.2 n=1 Tax=Zea mays TaxID=4577 RepID=A0A1D6PID5_MAIZE|nr:Sulfate transporter 1.2 [Zea mays]
MAGAAITIALQQLKGFLGIADFTKKSDIVSVMKSVWGNVHHGWNWQTILIGASFLAFLLVAKGKGIKALLGFCNRTSHFGDHIHFFVYITRADKHGVAIVKNIRKGINPASASLIYFTGPYLATGFKIGVVAGMIGLTEAIAIGRTFAGLKDYQIDGNKEMVALGTMNIVGSMTSCYVATAYLIWKVDKPDFLACMGHSFGVIFSSVEILRWAPETRKRSQQHDQKLPKTEFLIADLSPVIDIDTSGIHALEELLKALEKRKIQVRSQTS